MPNYYDDNYRPFLPDDRNAPILDIGCGQGDFVRYLHSLGYRNVSAVDTDESAIAALQGIEGVTAITGQMDGEALARMDRKWELIVAKQMLYYFDRQQAPAFVRALADALGEDGRLIVEIFNGALLSSRFTELKDPGILTAYTENGLRRLLEANGLKVEQMYGARVGGRGIRSTMYRLAQSLWFRLYRLLLVLERGRDDELPRIRHKSIIAIARRS